MSVLAGEPQQFDLTCTGTNTHVDANASPTYVIDKAPLTMRLSVDLRARRWCYRDIGCSAKLPIAAIGRDSLQLMAVRTPLNEANFDFNRTTGAYNRRLFTPQFTEPMVSTGQCIMAPFTPIN